MVKSTVLHGQGHTNQQRYSGVIRTDQVTLGFLSFVKQVILNLAGFGDGTKEVFLWTVPATGSSAYMLAPHPTLNCFNLITPLSQIQIIEHHLGDYKLRLSANLVITNRRQCCQKKKSNKDKRMGRWQWGEMRRRKRQFNQLKTKKSKKL